MSCVHHDVLFLFNFYFIKIEVLPNLLTNGWFPPTRYGRCFFGCLKIFLLNMLTWAGIYWIWTPISSSALIVSIYVKKNWLFFPPYYVCLVLLHISLVFSWFFKFGFIVAPATFLLVSICNNTKIGLTQGVGKGAKD